MADIVLPATTFLEHDYSYTAGGHTYLQIGRAVAQRYAECRSNHDVICASPGGSARAIPGSR